MEQITKVLEAIEGLELCADVRHKNLLTALKNLHSLLIGTTKKLLTTEEFDLIKANEELLKALGENEAAVMTKYVGLDSMEKSALPRSMTP